MRVLVFGSRTFADRNAVHGVLDLIASDLDDGERLYVINGFASGADRMADEWASAEENRAVPVRFPAKWQECAADCPDDDGRHRRRYHGSVRPAGDDYCPLAGIRRNQQMLDEGKPDQALGFIDKPLDQSRGSADMYRRLMAAGIQTALYQPGARP